jgi:glucosylceramidase
MRNWSRIALEWNLANDARFEPHTPGGCTECKGALTIDASIIRNVSYYIVAHASRFIPPGSVRIKSNWSDEMPNVAFITPSGEKVMIVLNEQKHVTPFTIVSNGRRISLEQPAESVVTYVW